MRSDSGVTLAELAVSMTLTAVLGAMVITFFVGANHAGRRTIADNQQIADARVTLDSWTSMIRVAGWLHPSPAPRIDRFEEITPTKIVFFANLMNRNNGLAVPDATTKIALLLQVSDATTGTGNLVEIVFGPDNATPNAVRQLGFLAGPTGGPGHPIFRPVTRTGVPVDMTRYGCTSGANPQVGLCLQTLQLGAGMLDPTLTPGTLQPVSGPLRGNPALNVDKQLQLIGGITIAFTTSDTHRTSTLDFQSFASVSSGFPT
jgi:hypothetical protein